MEEEEEEMEVEKKEVMRQYHLKSEDKVMNEQCEEVEDNSSSSSSSPPQTKNFIDNNTANRRRVMGWIVRSTIQCSTYRPPSTSSSISSDDNSRGLTYHDFHLALCIDVEVERNNSIQSLLLNST
jgi:hypothetical protein